MCEVPQDRLKQTVESQHSGPATFVQSVPIYESQLGRTVWNGAVQIFDLTYSPSGSARADAWSYGLPNGNRRVVAVLDVSPIGGAREAIRAAIVAEARATK